MDETIKRPIADKKETFPTPGNILGILEFQASCKTTTDIKMVRANVTRSIIPFILKLIYIYK